jgi:hypothetical protein
MLRLEDAQLVPRVPQRRRTQPAGNQQARTQRRVHGGATRGCGVLSRRAARGVARGTPRQRRASVLAQQHQHGVARRRIVQHRSQVERHDVARAEAGCVAACVARRQHSRHDARIPGAHRCVQQRVRICRRRARSCQRRQQARQRGEPPPLRRRRRRQAHNRRRRVRRERVSDCEHDRLCGVVVVVAERFVAQRCHLSCHSGAAREQHGPQAVLHRRHVAAAAIVQLDQRDALQAAGRQLQRHGLPGGGGGAAGQQWQEGAGAVDAQVARGVRGVRRNEDARLRGAERQRAQRRQRRAARLLRCASCRVSHHVAEQRARHAAAGVVHGEAAARHLRRRARHQRRRQLRRRGVRRSCWLRHQRVHRDQRAAGPHVRQRIQHVRPQPGAHQRRQLARQLMRRDVVQLDVRHDDAQQVWTLLRRRHVCQPGVYARRGAREAGCDDRRLPGVVPRRRRRRRRRRRCARRRQEAQRGRWRGCGVPLHRGRGRRRRRRSAQLRPSGRRQQ